MQWEEVRNGEKQIIEAGARAVLILTPDDVRCAIGRADLTDEVAMEALEMLHRKHEFNWADQIGFYVERAEE